ncbi:hypothetical protein EYF80_030574 [Liparis tanakae]|uniref:Uncharacterized protein n=1 Tax=Liparis tanakae TaxID=230148 RepID=A0A4Z2H0T3_9TELE|nr:hypothetical protein EYF80_030574 [Liparis tanakae]
MFKLFRAGSEKGRSCWLGPRPGDGRGDQRVPSDLVYETFGVSQFKVHDYRRVFFWSLVLGVQTPEDGRTGQREDARNFLGLDRRMRRLRGSRLKAQRARCVTQRWLEEAR